VSSTGAADDKAGPESKCKAFDGLSSADLAFSDGASLEIPGGGGGMASNLNSSAIKRDTGARQRDRVGAGARGGSSTV